MSALPASSPVLDPSDAGWPLLHQRPVRSVLGSVLDGASRSGRLPADLLIGVPLALVGRAVGRVDRLRTWALTD